MLECVTGGTFIVSTKWPENDARDTGSLYLTHWTTWYATASKSTCHDEGEEGVHDTGGGGY